VWRRWSAQSCIARPSAQRESRIDSIPKRSILISTSSSCDLSHSRIRMADNAPASVTNADQPGRPYYESLRNTLKSTLVKKRQLDEQLQALEDNIFKMESSYLEETNGAGNIVRGFDGWVKGVVVGGDKKSVDDRKARVRVRDEDRIFSRSSMSWIRVRAVPSTSSFVRTSY